MTLKTTPRAMAVAVAAAFLAAMGSAVAGESAGAQVKTKGDAARGRDVFVQQKCALCHIIADSGGRFGPDLTTVGTRRNAAWLLSYLPKPQASKPTNKMPPVLVKGQELDDLVAYLVSLKGKTRD